MANTKTDGGTAQMKWLWMLVGIAVTALVVWWIAANSEPSQVMVMSDEAADEQGADAAGEQAPPVTLVDLTTTPANYVGQAVRLPSATVTSVMGEKAFWVEGPGGNPFLVVKAEEFTSTGGASIQQGATLSITGEFWEQSSQTIQQWRESGFMTDPGYLAQAEFATHYIQAREIAPAAAGETTPGQ